MLSTHFASINQQTGFSRSQKLKSQKWETLNVDYYLKSGLGTESKLNHLDTPWENLEIIIKKPLSQKYCDVNVVF